MDVLEAGFNQAAKSAMVKGFAVGRSIFGEPTKAWLAGSIDDEAFIGQIKANYRFLVDVWNKRAL